MCRSAMMQAFCGPIWISHRSDSNMLIYLYSVLGWALQISLAHPTSLSSATSSSSGSSSHSQNDCRTTLNCQSGSLGFLPFRLGGNRGHGEPQRCNDSNRMSSLFTVNLRSSVSSLRLISMFRLLGPLECNVRAANLISHIPELVLPSAVRAKEPLKWNFIFMIAVILSPKRSKSQSSIPSPNRASLAH